MANNRINDFIKLEYNEIRNIFSLYDRNISIIDYCLLDNSMSNTGYMVTASSGKYFLKLYSNTTDKVEIAMYTYLKGIINVPEVFYYDGSKKYFEFAFAIVEFLEGKNLKYHFLSKPECWSDTVYEIGKMCGILHQRKYNRDAWLDANLNEQHSIPKTKEHILQLLNDKAEKHLHYDTIERVYDFIENHSEIFDRIHDESVLCHGDFNYGNIIISGGKPYFIDFEFAHAGSRYHDFGKFLRTKSKEIQMIIGDRIYNFFADGYNSVSSSTLPCDWTKFTHLCDIATMLSLINRDNVPTEWVTAIEHDIIQTITEK